MSQGANVCRYWLTNQTFLISRTRRCGVQAAVICRARISTPLKRVVARVRDWTLLFADSHPLPRALTLRYATPPIARIAALMFAKASFCQTAQGRCRFHYRRFIIGRTLYVLILGRGVLNCEMPIHGTFRDRLGIF